MTALLDLCVCSDEHPRFTVSREPDASGWWEIRDEERQGLPVGVETSQTRAHTAARWFERNT